MGRRSYTSPQTLALQRVLERTCQAWLGLSVAGVFLFDPRAQDDAFFVPKFAFFSLWAVVGLALLLGRLLAGRALLLPLNAVFFAAVLFCGWNVVAVTWARSPGLGWDRVQRLAAMLVLLWFGTHVVRRRGLFVMGGIGVAAAVLTGLWVLAEDYIRAFAPGLVWVTPNLPDWRGYLAAGLGNTNHIGDLLALALLPAMVFFGSTRRAAKLWAAGLACVVLAAALIVCYSVGSNLGLIVGSGLMLALVLLRDGGQWFWRRRVRWAALLAAWVAVVVFFNVDQPLNPHRPGILKQGFGSERWQEGAPTRLVIWAEGLEMIRLRPWTGYGPGNFTYVFPEMDSRLLSTPALLRYQGLWTNAAHNELLQAWTELGIVGLALLVLLIGVAFYDAGRGLGAVRWPDFLLRATLLGLLAGWVAQAQMNFALQHPVGMLTLFFILLAIVVEKRTRHRAGGAMPSLLWETGLLRLRVDWHAMNKPTALGLALRLPAGVALTGTLLLLAGALALGPYLLRPVLAQREYRKAIAARNAGDADAAERRYRRALKLYPEAQDIRSSYSEWLVRMQRPEDALRELKRVRERLNSNELWLREAAALEQLGKHDQAAKARATAMQRVWVLRNPQ